MDARIDHFLDPEARPIDRHEPDPPVERCSVCGESVYYFAVVRDFTLFCRSCAWPTKKAKHDAA